MILPKSFGLFCQRLGAHPYSDGRIEPFSRSRSNSDAFGFGAIFNVETGVVRFTIGPREGLDLSTVLLGTVGLYRYVDTRQDYLISQTSFDQTMRRADGSWVVTFNTDGDYNELWGACELDFVSSQSLSSIVEVAHDLSKKPKQLPFQLKPRSSFNMKDGLQTVPTKQIVVQERELRTAVSLDFSKYNPVAQGLGSLFYSGGGMRYLPSVNGPILQTKNQAPWQVEAKTLIEPQGGNFFPKYGLHETCWSWGTVSTNEDINIDGGTASSTYTSSQILDGGTASSTYTSSQDPDDKISTNSIGNERFFTINGFTERLLGLSVYQSQGINCSWRLDFDQVPWTGDTVTGSAFVQTTLGSGVLCKFEIGLRMFDSDGTTLRSEIWQPIDATKLSIQSITWPRPLSTSATIGKIQLSLRATDLNRGDQFDLVVGFPQLEYVGCAGSRSTGTRIADLVTFSPSYTFASDYGRFVMEFSPNYRGVPGTCGPQLFLDTRDSSGRNGFWIGQRPDGLFEWGCADASGSTFVRSASVIQMDGDTTYRLVAYWDSTMKNLRLDLNGDLLVERNLNTLTVPTTLPVLRFGTKYDGAHAGSFELFTFKHEMTTE